MKWTIFCLFRAIGAFTFEKFLPVPLRPGNWFKVPSLSLENDTVRRESVNGYQAMKKLALENIEIVPLSIDSGWQRFAFGNISTDAIPQYEFNLTDLGYVWVTDAYCRGDSFYIFNNDQLFGETSSTIEDGCKTNATDPSDAVQDGTFGHVYFNLTTGQYRFRMMVKDSPFLAGKAFIRLDSTFKTPGEKPPTTSTETSTETTSTGTIVSTDLSTIDNGGTLTSSATTGTSTSRTTGTFPSGGTSFESYSADSSLEDLLTPDTALYDRFRCRITRDRMYIFTTPLQPETARYVCKKFKLELAVIDNQTLVDAMKLAWECNGGKKGARFWIEGYEAGSVAKRGPRRNRGWKPNPAGHASFQFQLMTGQEYGRGSIIKAKDFREPLPFICQRPRLHHPDL